MQKLDQQNHQTIWEGTYQVNSKEEKIMDLTLK
jgi:hypothetical protein